MLKIIQKACITFLQILLINCFATGQNCSGIVVNGPDTCRLIPQDFTNSANFVKTAMDEEKKAHNELVFQIRDLKQQRDTLRAQKKVMMATIQNREKALEDCHTSLGKCDENSAKKDTVITWQRWGLATLSIVAIVETLILVIR